jgi:ribosomal RNA small subunit methyltransferase A
MKNFAFMKAFHVLLLLQTALLVSIRECSVHAFSIPTALGYPTRRPLIGTTGVPNGCQTCPSRPCHATALAGWVEKDGEWEWEENDPNYVPPTTTVALAEATATPKLPAGSYKPKQSLGQNYLKDPNTVAKILRTFHQDATKHRPSVERILELGPGAGALTDRLVETYGAANMQAIELDERSVQILREKHPGLRVQHADVMQVSYPDLAEAEGQPLVVIGNLPYYITSQILFALADASHAGAVHSATVTMQWEVGQRMVAARSTKDYGILSVVFQLYADVTCHFKIPPTVFYPKPKVDSALIGLHFLGPARLRQRLAGVRPADLRRVVTATFQQRRKTVRNSLKKLCREIVPDGDAEQVQLLLNSPPPFLPASVMQAREEGDEFSIQQELPEDWASKRPEELSPGQFIEITRLLFGPADGQIDSSVSLGSKVWRKLKHGTN